MYNISRTIDSKLCKSTDGEKGIFNKNLDEEGDKIGTFEYVR